MRPSGVDPARLVKSTALRRERFTAPPPRHTGARRHGDNRAVLPLQDPIVAVATAPGRGAVGIVRVSGRGLAPLIDALTGRTPAPRTAQYVKVRAGDGTTVDQGLALWFPAPQSYTGEDVFELQVHGGTVVLQLLLARCLAAAAEVDPATLQARLPFLRMAQPGEFTLRAFLNGKLDLTQAEAVADLIDAGTEAAARSASRSLDGVFSREVDAVAARIVELRALVEATLDFPDEEIDFLERADAQGRLAAIARALAGLRDRTHQGVLLRDGMTVVLAGQPNVGKSSLLNALAGAELAIVTAIAGTTRDKIGQTIQIEGVPVHVVDTAGLRDEAQPHDEVERLGIARSWAEIERADTVIFLHDLTRLGETAYQAADRVIAARLQASKTSRVMHVFNKCDAVAAGASDNDGVRLSARTGEGLQTLRQAMLERAGWHANPEGVFIARTRHLLALERTAGYLEQARRIAERGDAELELLAEELRLAHDALGEITGKFSAHDLLGEIFGRFCIGK